MCVCCPVKMQYATTNKELLVNRLEDGPSIFLFFEVDVRGCVMYVWCVCVCECVLMKRVRSFVRLLIISFLRKSWEHLLVISRLHTVCATLHFTALHLSTLRYLTCIILRYIILYSTTMLGYAMLVYTMLLYCTVRSRSRLIITNVSLCLTVCCVLCCMLCILCCVALNHVVWCGVCMRCRVVCLCGVVWCCIIRVVLASVRLVTPVDRTVHLWCWPFILVKPGPTIQSFFHLFFHYCSFNLLSSLSLQ